MSDVNRLAFAVAVMLTLSTAPVQAQTYAPAPRALAPVAPAPSDVCAPAPQGQGSASPQCRQECTRNPKYSPHCPQAAAPAPAPNWGAPPAANPAPAMGAAPQAPGTAAQFGGSLAPGQPAVRPGAMNEVRPSLPAVQNANAGAAKVDRTRPSALPAPSLPAATPMSSDGSAIAPSIMPPAGPGGGSTISPATTVAPVGPAPGIAPGGAAAPTDAALARPPQRNASATGGYARAPAAAAAKFDRAAFDVDFGAVYSREQVRRTVVLNTDGPGEADFSLNVANAPGFAIVEVRVMGQGVRSRPASVTDALLPSNATRQREDSALRTVKTSVKAPPWKVRFDDPSELQVDVLYAPQFNLFDNAAGPKSATLIGKIRGSDAGGSAAITLTANFQGLRLGVSAVLDEREIYAIPTPNLSPDALHPLNPSRLLIRAANISGDRLRLRVEPVELPAGVSASPAEADLLKDQSRTIEFPLQWRPRAGNGEGQGRLRLTAGTWSSELSFEIRGRGELVLELTTGADDLRGGRDNINAILIKADGTRLRFDNVNEGKGLAGGSHLVVRRPLPPVNVDDLAALRLETTVTGGIGGDNWNLDRVKLSVRSGTETRTLLEQQGKPLFRFTGEHRVRDFQIGSRAPAQAPAVMTAFDPKVHGYKFANEFNIPFGLFDIAWAGQCGGMSWSALDYFLARQTIPQQSYMPAVGMPLQKYILARQVRSIETRIDQWSELAFNPGGARNGEFFTWGLLMGSGRLGELMSHIDHGRPVPIGLWECGSDCGCTNCLKSHQVLAIGYELGRYAGVPAQYAEDVRIYVYDPNYPGKTMTLRPRVKGQYYSYDIDGRESPNARWRAYYVATKYSPQTPPVVGSNPNELWVSLFTGNDDLRGGQDNVDLTLILRDGRTFRYPAVNDGNRWMGQSKNDVARELPPGVTATDVAGIRLDTNFGGGIGGDNWNLDAIQIHVRVGGGPWKLLFQEQGNPKPLVRFTGNMRSREFRW